MSHTGLFLNILGLAAKVFVETKYQVALEQTGQAFSDRATAVDNLTEKRVMADEAGKGGPHGPLWVLINGLIVQISARTDYHEYMIKSGTAFRTKQDAENAAEAALIGKAAPIRQSGDKNIPDYEGMINKLSSADRICDFVLDLTGRRINRTWRLETIKESAIQIVKDHYGNKRN